MKKTNPTNKEKPAPGTATVTHVAEFAGVSLGTVSRVMNGEKTVNPEIRRKVLKTARSIGFVPRVSTRRLGMLVEQTDRLAVSVGYSPIITSLIEKCAYARGLAVESFDVEHIERAFDCGIMAVIAIVFDDALDRLKDVPQLPLIAINHPMPHNGIHSIYTDHNEQGAAATRHLIKAGHTRIAFLGKGNNEWGTQQRVAGYRAAMQSAKIPGDPELVKFSDDAPLYTIIHGWLENGVTAILNFSDRVVAETLHILTNVLGARIGRDISTITLEDVPLYQYFSPPQTVIRQPLLKIAQTAVDLAISLSSATEPPDKIADLRFLGELIVRESVKNLKDE